MLRTVRSAILLPKRASVSFQSFATEAAGTTTSTFTGLNLGPGAFNRIIAVGIIGRLTSTGTQSVASVTIGGVAATRVPAAAAILLDVGSSEIWYANVPFGNSGDVVVTWGLANVRSGVYVYSILTSKAAPLSAGGTSANGSTQLSLAVSVPQNGVGIVAYFHRQTGNTLSFTNATGDSFNQLSGASQQTAGGHFTFPGSYSVSGNASPNPNDSYMSLAVWGP